MHVSDASTMEALILLHLVVIVQHLVKTTQFVQMQTRCARGLLGILASFATGQVDASAQIL